MFPVKNVHVMLRRMSDHIKRDIISNKVIRRVFDGQQDEESEVEMVRICKKKGVCMRY